MVGLADRAASQAPLGRLGAGDIVENISGDFDLIVDGAGGPTFGLAIEHVAARGVVVNIATQGDAETVTREPSRALGALLQRRIGGKAVLHVD